jgi:hypothetical protein
MKPTVELREGKTSETVYGWDIRFLVWDLEIFVINLTTFFGCQLRMYFACSCDTKSGVFVFTQVAEISVNISRRDETDPQGSVQRVGMEVILP